ncbi:MAG TPA: hypothetical protein VH596_02400 [Terriglobales bacterium]
MKANSGLRVKSALLATIVLVAGSAFAANNKGSLELQHPTSVAGKQLASGNYNLRWEGTGDDVQLKIYQGKSVVATTSARVVKIDHRPQGNSAVVNNNPDGTSALSEIRFGGKDYALQIVNDGGGAAASGASH